MGVVGATAPRKEGPDKLCGLAKYVDDLVLPGCLHGVTLRSAIAHGRVEKIHFDPRFEWDKCVIATARDIPGQNHVALIEQDQPLLVTERVMHPAEPVLLLAHADRATAYDALRHIHVEYVEEPAVLDLEAALRRETLIRGEDNLLKQLKIQKGDVEAALRTADFVVEGEYRVPHQEQAYIENNGIAAWWEEDGTLVATGSLQCPYYVHQALKVLFDLPEDKVRVIHAMTGGGFGGKEEYPSLLAGHAALLALKARRPVKIIYDRHEDMLATTKRHPARVRHRTGVNHDGKLVAQDIDVVMDGGAYVTLSPVVLSRGILHATGPYECPNVRVVGRTVATNSPPSGAFRGFGAPQTLFAAELHFERIAAATGIDALTLRRRNLVREGSVMATGQVLRESVGAEEVLERAVKRSGFARRRQEHARWNRRRTNPTWRGIGLAVVHHGAGFTGSGETYLASVVAVTLTRHGRIVASASSTEMGQGATSTLAQIVAHTLGVPYDLVDVETPDTALVPDSGPTVASRTCMIVGGLLQQAALQLKNAITEELGEIPHSRDGLRRAGRRLCGAGRERRFTAQYRTPGNVQWDEATYRGDAYPVYSYACAVVDLEVDKTTYEVKIHRLVTAQDVGKAINPTLAEGQIVGGTAQALGYALLENAIFENGAMQNTQLTNYIIPTTMDVPVFEVEIVEKPFSGGPFGAKGLGELPMDAPAPAVAAAIHQATGLLICQLPILPETIERGLRDRADGE